MPARRITRPYQPHPRQKPGSICPPHGRLNSGYRLSPGLRFDGSGDCAMTAMAMVQAVNSAMDVMLARDPGVVVFGEDVGFYGGVFRVTEGLQQKHGEQRVFDAPIAEGGMLAVAGGLGAYRFRPGVENQFADYIYPATDPPVSQAAGPASRSGGEIPAPVYVPGPFVRRQL